MRKRDNVDEVKGNKIYYSEQLFIQFAVYYGHTKPHSFGEETKKTSPKSECSHINKDHFIVMIMQFLILEFWNVSTFNHVTTKKTQPNP